MDLAADLVARHKGHFFVRNAKKEIFIMRVLMAQFKIKAEALEHFEASRDKILSALSQAGPKGVRYTWCALPDGASFVGWLELDEGVDNPLPGMDVGREFMEKIKNWVVEPPIREELRVVGSYGSAQ